MLLASPPPTGNQLVEVMKTEEKGSDVNLATYLLLDGFRDEYETAEIISGDSDLAEPVNVIRNDFGKTILVLSPRPNAKGLQRAATRFKVIDPKILALSQFPDSMTDIHGTFTKPAVW